MYGSKVKQLLLYLMISSVSSNMAFIAEVQSYINGALQKHSKDPVIYLRWRALQQYG